MAWEGLSVAELREHVSTGLGDAALQRLLDASREAILLTFGTAPPGLDSVSGGQSYIFLRYPATAITAIAEGDPDSGEIVDLDPDDFWLRDDGVSIQRAEGGPNSRFWWGSPVVVEYDTPSVDADLDRVQIALVELDLNHLPGLTSETIGSWNEQANSGRSYEEERSGILASVPSAGPPAPGFA